MEPNIPEPDWEQTPGTVKAYVLALRAAVQRLQARLDEPSRKQDKPTNDLCFNGLTDYLITPTPLLVSTESFSFEARLYVNGNRAGEFKIIHMFGPSQEPHGMNWVLGPAKNVAWLSYQWGGVWWGLIDDRGVFHAIHSGPAKSGDVNPPLAYMNRIDSVPVDSWHHVAGTWDGQVMKLYVDGEIAEITPFSGGVTLSTKAFIGAHYGGTSQFLPGRLDDVRIWNRALRQDEVLQHRNGGLAKNRESLVIEYCSSHSPAFGPVRDQVADHRRTLQLIRRRIPEEEFEQLSPGEADLIEDLVEHLQCLERKAEM
jgi:hypothetical protein